MDDAQKGKFLPKDVWVAKGFDGDRIATHSEPCDIEEHPVLGLTYRLNIHQTTDSRKREAIQQDVRKLFFKGRRKGNQLADRAAEPEPQRDASELEPHRDASEPNPQDGVGGDEGP